MQHALHDYRTFFHRKVDPVIPRPKTINFPSLAFHNSKRSIGIARALK